MKIQLDVIIEDDGTITTSEFEDVVNSAIEQIQDIRFDDNGGAVDLTIASKTVVS